MVCSCIFALSPVVGRAVRLLPKDKRESPDSSLIMGARARERLRRASFMRAGEARDTPLYNKLGIIWSTESPVGTHFTITALSFLVCGLLISPNIPIDAIKNISSLLRICGVLNLKLRKTLSSCGPTALGRGGESWTALACLKPDGSGVKSKLRCARLQTRVPHRGHSRPPSPGGLLFCPRRRFLGRSTTRWWRDRERNGRIRPLPPLSRIRIRRGCQ